MAALKEIAKEYKDEIMDGIAWVAIWKTGRSWNAKTFWLNPLTDRFEYEDEAEEAKRIVAADENAIFINEYYTAHMGEGGLNEIMNGIKFMYGNNYNLLKDSEAYEAYIKEAEKREEQATKKYKWTGRVELVKEEGKLEESLITGADSLRAVYKEVLEECRSYEGEAIAEIYEDIMPDEIRRSVEKYVILKTETGLIALTERDKFGAKKKGCRIREDHAGYSVPMKSKGPEGKDVRPEEKRQDKKYEWVGRVNTARVKTNEEMPIRAPLYLTDIYGSSNLRKVYEHILETCKAQDRGEIRTIMLADIYKRMSKEEARKTKKLPDYEMFKAEDGMITLMKPGRICTIRKPRKKGE